jgi:hypothetical protein
MEHMSILSFLREADFVTKIAFHAAILFFSIHAYHRTGLKALALLICGSVLGVALAVGLRMHGYVLQPEDAPTFYYFYRIGIIAAGGLTVTGTLLLIRYVVADSDSRERNTPSRDTARAGNFSCMKLLLASRIEDIDVLGLLNRY